MGVGVGGGGGGWGGDRCSGRALVTRETEEPLKHRVQPSCPHPHSTDEKTEAQKALVAPGPTVSEAASPALLWPLNVPELGRACCDQSQPPCSALLPRQSPFSLHCPRSQSGHTQRDPGPARPRKDKPKYLVSAEGNRASILAQSAFLRPPGQEPCPTQGHEPPLPTMS